MCHLSKCVSNALKCLGGVWSHTHTRIHTDTHKHIWSTQLPLGIIEFKSFIEPVWFSVKPGNSFHFRFQCFSCWYNTQVLCIQHRNKFTNVLSSYGLKRSFLRWDHIQWNEFVVNIHWVVFTKNTAILCGVRKKKFGHSGSNLFLQ